ncbi:MAG: TetR/AcrR family transcriptional regulator [Catenulispora sp.]|nr:TetR/AcrR family transcriptional regulator [Catenulispora sp.]
MEGRTTTDRRERLRAATTTEIKEVALRLMAASGPDAITLRAIAREMGMTPNAIYSYFATRDDLVTTLISDVLTDLADCVDAAWQATAGQSPATRITAWADAFRTWSLNNPQGFRLIFGDPVPGYKAPEGGPAPEATSRICISVTNLAAAAWPHAEHLQHGGDFAWSDFDPALAADVRTAFPDLPPAALALALRIRGRLHGLVSLEVYGHTQGTTAASARLFDEEVSELLQSLGLPATTRSR